MTATENFDLLLAELAKTMQVPALERDEVGIVVLEIDGLPLYLQFASGRESLVLTCELAVLPPDAPAAPYRRLLAAQLFDQGTGGGKFALDESSNTVVFTFERVLDGLPYAQFEEILGNFLRVCEHWRGILTGPDAGASEKPGPDAPSGLRA
ncbi:MAG: type III secretion system chaperone [Planctomycetes bacterium]|nr:type III secretion system chaperone [Planctomycetota bacterium]